MSVEVWIFIGLAIGLVCLIVAVVWVVFCFMLYRHQREHASDEDYHEVSQKIMMTMRVMYIDLVNYIDLLFTVLVCNFIVLYNVKFTYDFKIN